MFTLVFSVPSAVTVDAVPQGSSDSCLQDFLFLLSLPVLLLVLALIFVFWLFCNQFFLKETKQNKKKQPTPSKKYPHKLIKEKDNTYGLMSALILFTEGSPLLGLT